MFTKSYSFRFVFSSRTTVVWVFWNPRFVQKSKEIKHNEKNVLFDKLNFSARISEFLSASFAGIFLFFFSPMNLRAPIVTVLCVHYIYIYIFRLPAYRTTRTPTAEYISWRTRPVTSVPTASCADVQFRRTVPTNTFTRTTRAWPVRWTAWVPSRRYSKICSNVPATRPRFPATVSDVFIYRLLFFFFSLPSYFIFILFPLLTNGIFVRQRRTVVQSVERQQAAREQLAEPGEPTEQ